MSDIRDFFEGFKKGFKAFGYNINLIVNTILLSIVYFIGVGITSIIAKLIKKKFLQTNLSKESETYWSQISSENKGIEEYYRQF